MTVENTNNTISYTGNGSVDTFAYNFLAYKETHIFVYFNDILQAVGYTVTGIGDEGGGDIVFNSPPNLGVTVRIDRTVPETQLIEYQEYGPFPAKTNERGLDLLTMAVQQNSRDITRELSSKMDKRPDAGVRNIVIFDSEGNSEDSKVSVDGFNVFSSANAKSYGAVGDGINDDSDALQEWADVGGRLFLPRGNYRVTKQINFGPVTTLFGESAGAGTGGGEDVDEASAGASIIRPDVVNWSGDDHVFLFENKKVDLKAAPSVVIQDIKIECPREKGVEAHLLTVVNAYDSLLIQNVNLIFSHKDYNALRLIEIDGTIFPRLSQTGVVMNVVTIGDDDNGDSANYVGDGVITEFLYDFLIPDIETLDVFVDNVLQDPLTYSVTGIGSATGGSVTFLTAPALGLDVRINGVRSVVPVAYLRRQQEMQLIGLKSFGTAAKYYTQCQRVPTALEGCRGITGGAGL